VELVAKRYLSNDVSLLGDRAEKIGRDEFTLQRRGGGQLARKTKQVGALRNEGNTEPLAEEPWGSGPFISSETRGRKIERATEKERAFSLGQRRAT
jgi:hypothetical protein